MYYIVTLLDLLLRKKLTFMITKANKTWTFLIIFCKFLEGPGQRELFSSLSSVVVACLSTMSPSPGPLWGFCSDSSYRGHSDLKDRNQRRDEQRWGLCSREVHTHLTGCTRAARWGNVSSSAASCALCCTHLLRCKGGPCVQLRGHAAERHTKVTGPWTHWLQRY